MTGIMVRIRGLASGQYLVLDFYIVLTTQLPSFSINKIPLAKSSNSNDAAVSVSLTVTFHRHTASGYSYPVSFNPKREVGG